MSTALRLSDVSRHYGSVRAVNEVTLDVPEGQRLAIIGPNGAGKSTLFGVVAGEHRPTAGRVEAFGRDVTTWHPSRMALHGVSRTFQVARVFSTRSVWENVLLAVRAKQAQSLRGWDVFGDDTAQQSTVQWALGMTRLEGVRDQRAADLAQGDRKLLEVAMALAQRPKLLLLDEPTAGMSYEDSLRTVEVLKSVSADDPSLTLVLSAHDMEVVFALAQRIVLMHQGEVVLDGSPNDVSADPRTREIYLGTEEQ